MYSFGQLKNSLRRLEDLNKNMNFLTQLKWNKSVFDQKQIKNQPMQFYLRIIHFAMTQFSPDFYRQILDIVPNIKTLRDQKFIQCAMNIARKMFNMNPKLTVEQFLQTNKLVEKRLQFMVDFCEHINNWQLAIDKKTKKKEQESRYQMKMVRPQFDDEDEGEDQDIIQRELNIEPTNLGLQFQGGLDPSKGLYNKTETRLSAHEFAGKETVSLSKGRTNMFPKKMNPFAEDDDQNYSFSSTCKPSATTIAKPVPSVEAADESVEDNEPVTREQLNEVIGMISTLNLTISGLVSKFNSLQTHVGAQVSKTNARISLLEQSVKIIKENI